MTLVQAIAAAVKAAKPTSETDTIVSVIHETYDYGKFGFLDSNRPTNRPHVIRLKESMDEEYLISPITVNENFWIIDGQHRFEAAKEKGLPVRYIVAEGYGSDQMKRFNVNSSNWGKKEYLHHYVAEKHPEYLKFKLFMETYPDFSLTTALSIVNGSTVHTERNIEGKRVLTKDFDRGLLQIKDYNHAVKTAESLMQIKPYYENYNMQSFVNVIRILLKDDNYNHSRMVQKFKLHKNNPDLVYRPARQIFVWDMLKNLYNFKVNRNNRVYLPFEKFKK